MDWENFFYFSKGERRVLTLLLLLIAVALVLLILKDHYIPDGSGRNMAEDKISSTISDTVPAKPDSETKEPAKTTKRTSPAKEKYSVKPRFTKSASTFSQKYPKGTIVELNTTDTIVLKKVPGIGSVFANRIIKYRELLGGYTSVNQLREVYGIDDEKFNALYPWFDADTTWIRKLAINHHPLETLVLHPYISYKQARVIINLRERKGKLSGWQNLDLLEEFTNIDKERLSVYVSFE